MVGVVLELSALEVVLLVDNKLKMLFLFSFSGGLSSCCPVFARFSVAVPIFEGFVEVVVPRVRAVADCLAEFEG